MDFSFLCSHNEPITMLITTLCDWFAFSASASDFYISVFHIIISEGVVESSAESERCSRRKSCISKPMTHTVRPHYEKLLRFSELTVSKLLITKKFRLVKVLWKVFHFFFSTVQLLSVECKVGLHLRFLIIYQYKLFQ